MVPYEDRIVFPPQHKFVSVTVLDANHCPGSVMFLFEGDFGRVLYTGDFRFEADSEIFVSEAYQRLFSGKLTLDIVYLDNTYWAAGGSQEFPKREEAIEEVKQIIQDNPDSDIVIGLTKLGKEELLYRIGTDLDECICVDYNKWHLLEVLNAPDVFTRFPEEARVAVINRFKIMEELRKSENQTQLLAILPSALPLLIPDRFEWMTERGSKWREKCKWVVYSDHSSRTELTQFLSRLKIRQIIPIAQHMSFDEKSRFLTGDTRQVPAPVASSSGDNSATKTIGPENPEFYLISRPSDSANFSNRKGSAMRKRRKFVSGRPPPPKSKNIPDFYLSSPEPSPEKRKRLSDSVKETPEKQEQTEMKLESWKKYEMPILTGMETTSQKTDSASRQETCKSQPTCDRSFNQTELKIIAALFE